MVDFRANAPKGLSMSNPGPIFDAMKNGINYMADRVAQLVECCSSAARQSCDCGWSFGDIRQFTDGRGFYEFEAEVSPSISLDTFCVCFNEFQVSEEEYPLDSGEVIVSTTLDEINFSDSLSISISDLREILLGFGDAANALNLSFFGAITDQNVFCKSEELPLSIRTLSNTNHLEFEEKLASADYGLWFNILHFNGTATVSILARGFDQNFIEMALSADCLNTSEWHFCAFNNLMFGFTPYSNRPDGIVIHGANNSKITIINEIVKTNFYLPQYNFYGQWEVDLSRVAIGFEARTGRNTAALFGNKIEVCKVKTMFLGGDYYGYFYDYLGYIFNVILTTSFQLTTTYGGSLFIAFNDSEIGKYPTSYSPSGFAGEFNARSLSFSFKKILLGANLDFQQVWSVPAEPDPDWVGFSLGISGQSGPQQGFFKGFGIEHTYAAFGELVLVTPEVPTKDRSLRDRAFNLIQIYLINF